MFLKTLEVQQKYDEGLVYIASCDHELLDQEKNILCEFQVNFLLYKGEIFFSEAYKIAKSIFDENPDNFQCMLLFIKTIIKKDSADKVSKIHSIIDYYKKSHQLTYIEKFELAELFYSNNLFADAALFYREIYELVVESPIIRKLLISLYNCGDYKAALELIEEMHSIEWYNDVSTELGVKIYHFIGDLPNAERICNEHLIKYPHEDKVKYFLVTTLFYQGKYAEVDKFIERDIDISLLSIKEKFQLVYLYVYRLKYEKAIKLAYKIRNEDYLDNYVHELYINFSLLKVNDIAIDYLKEPEIVTIETIVLVKYNSTREYYYISNNGDIFESTIKLHPNDYIASKLMGLSEGSTVCLSDPSIPFSEKKVKIEKIFNKYHFSFIDSKLKLRFCNPCDLSVKEINFNQIDPDENKALFQVIEQLVKKRNEIQLNIINSYKNLFLPIGSVLIFFNQSIFDILNILASDKKSRIFCNEPSDFLFLEDMIPFLDGQNKIVIDTGILISLFRMDLPNSFFEKYGKLLITQSSRDIVQYEICSLLGNEKESLSFGYDNDGNLVKYVHSVEDKIRHKESLELLLNWIDEKCEIVPVSSLLNQSSEERKKYRNLLDKAYFDTLFLSSEPGNILISDDYRFRIIVEQEFGSKCIPSQLLLKDSLISGTIGEEKYHDSLILLVSSHYSVIFIDGDTLFRAAELASWDFQSPFINLLYQLSPDQYSLNYVIKISLQFINRVCTEKDEDTLIISLMYLFSQISLKYNMNAFNNTILPILKMDISIDDIKRNIIIDYLISWN